MITKTNLEARWSKALIKKFNPTIVKQKRNIYGGTTTYYSLEEIEATEQSEAFKEEYKKAMKRKIVARERSIEVEKKQREAKIAQFINSLCIELPSKEQLIKEAIEHYNYRNWDSCPDVSDYSKDFILRITQNYVRHICSNYEDILCCSKGKYKGEAYYALKEYINNKVEEKLNNYEII